MGNAKSRKLSNAKKWRLLQASNESLIWFIVELLEATDPFVEIPIPSTASDHHPINYSPVTATFGDLRNLRLVCDKIEKELP